MPIVVLVALIIGLTLAMFLFLRPLKVLAKKEFLISHGFIIAGLFVILGWLWLNLPEYEAECLNNLLTTDYSQSALDYFSKKASMAMVGLPVSSKAPRP